MALTFVKSSGIDATGSYTMGNIAANGAGLSSLTGSNVTGQVGNSLIAGTVYTNAQPNITSVGTLTSVTVTGNANVGTLNTTSIVATGNITGANVVSANLFTGALTTNSQPNITSVGTLTSLAVSGTSNLGAVGNVTITGGTTGQVLTTNGSNVLSWSTVSGGTGGGSSLTYTAATTPPGTANVADQWYNTSTGVLYEYVNDGTTSYWVDVQTPTFSTAPLPVTPHPFVFLGI